MRGWLRFNGLGAVGILGLGLCCRHVEQAARSGDVTGARIVYSLNDGIREALSRRPS